MVIFRANVSAPPVKCLPVRLWGDTLLRGIVVCVSMTSIIDNHD